MPRAAVSAAIFSRGQILLGQRAKPPLEGIWSLPGGHVEPGEKARDAVMRELDEETGMAPDILGVANVTDVILRSDDGGLRAQYVITVFYGTSDERELSPGSDCKAAEWVDIGKLDDRELTRGTREIILEAKRLLDGGT